MPAIVTPNQPASLVAAQPGIPQPPQKTPDRDSGALSMQIVVAVLTVLLTGGAALVWGWEAASAILTFVTGCAALAELLIKIGKKWEQANQKASAAKSLTKNPLGIMILTTLLTGMAIGALAIPLLIAFVLRPSASLHLQDTVSTPQEFGLSWRNLTAADNLWVLVRNTDQTTEFVPPCRVTGSKKGAITCTADIGGSDDAGNQFEIRVIRLNRSASEQLARLVREQGYVERLPEGAAVLSTKIVKRIEAH